MVIEVGQYFKVVVEQILISVMYFRDNFACVRADKMLMMVTIITTAAYIIDRESHEKVKIW